MEAIGGHVEGVGSNADCLVVYSSCTVVTSILLTPSAKSPQTISTHNLNQNPCNKRKNSSRSPSPRQPPYASHWYRSSIQSDVLCRNQDTQSNHSSSRSHSRPSLRTRNTVSVQCPRNPYNHSGRRRSPHTRVRAGRICCRGSLPKPLSVVVSWRLDAVSAGVVEPRAPVWHRCRT